MAMKIMRTNKVSSNTSKAHTKKTSQSDDSRQTKEAKKKERLEKVHSKVEESLAVFQSEYKKLKKMVGSDAKDFQSDKSTLAMLRSLLAMTIDLIPIAEAKFRAKGDEFSSRAVINLTSQARELASDIRNLKDVEAQVQHISQEIVQPAMMEIVNHLINENYVLKKEITTTLKTISKRKVLQNRVDKSLESDGEFISKKAYDIRMQLEKYLLN